MRRSAYVVGVVLIALLAAGCARKDPAADSGAPGPGGGPAGTTVGDADPVALIGLWQVTGAAGEETDAVLRIAPQSLSLWRDCGTLLGGWQADTSGLFIADLFGSTGCPATDQLLPGWLRDAAGYQVVGEERALLDGEGEPVARLLPGGKPKPNPNLAASEAEPPVVTDEVRRSLTARTAELPAGLAAADRGALVGRWVPASGTAVRPKSAFLELRADGSYTGSDGCNGVGGRWVSGRDGALLATSGVSTLIACDNVPIGQWLGTARRAGLVGETLALVDAQGKETGRLKPAR